MKKCADINKKKTGFARGHLKATVQVSYMTNPCQQHWRRRPNRNCLESCTLSVEKLKKSVWAPAVSGFLVEFVSDIVPRNESTLWFGPSTFLFHERIFYISYHRCLFTVVPQLALYFFIAHDIIIVPYLRNLVIPPYKFRCSSATKPALSFTLKFLVQPA